MTPELIICIPGTWADRNDFLRRVITSEPAGQYMFAGMVLADVAGKDHVPAEIYPADPRMSEAFEIAGQGRLPSPILSQLQNHTTVVYLHFPLDLLNQLERIKKFTKLLQSIGGIAVKVESSGIAHAWDRWFTLLAGSTFDVYCSAVVLLADQDHFYSCGMHHFGLPDCELSATVPTSEAANTMNRFNFWQIVEKPKLAPNHTFSLTPTSPHYRLSLGEDRRHGQEDLFRNPTGIWRLDPM